MIQLTDEELQELIKEREESVIIGSTTFDCLLESKVHNDNLRSFWIIAKADIVKRFFELNPKTEWKLSGIYQLDDVFYDVAVYKENEKGFCLRPEPNILFHFSKNDFKKVEIGFNHLLEKTELKYNSGVNFYEENGLNKDGMNVRYFTKESSDPKDIEIHSVLLFGKSISAYSLKSLDFVYIKKDDLNYSYLSLLSRYKKAVTDFYGMPTTNEECKPLGELVDFIDGYLDQPTYGDIYIYGYNLDKHVDNSNTYNSFCPELRIINDDYDKCYVLESYYDGDGQAIIRCKDKSFRKYLSVYLSKEMTFIEDLVKYGDFSKGDDLYHLPVFIPSDLTKFDSLYDDIISSQEKDKNEISFQNKVYTSTLGKNDLDFDILFNNVERTKFERTKQIIDKDLNEFKACVNCGAYKAALIMAGSILEAFLIDWLSEEDGKDYFKEDYMIEDYGKKRYATLNDYIKILHDKYELREPNWNQGKEKADYIKDKRNLVHAKLFIKEKDINIDTCIQVYSYLQYIRDFRFNRKELAD